nr:MAG TPA: hypothetical protein [Caudoviricetes sp.]
MFLLLERRLTKLKWLQKRQLYHETLPKQTLTMHRFPQPMHKIVQIVQNQQLTQPNYLPLLLRAVQLPLPYLQRKHPLMHLQQHKQKMTLLQPLVWQPNKQQMLNHLPIHPLKVQMQQQQVPLLLKDLQLLLPVLPRLQQRKQQQRTNLPPQQKRQRLMPKPLKPTPQAQLVQHPFQKAMLLILQQQQSLQRLLQDRVLQVHRQAPAQPLLKRTKLQPAPLMLLTVPNPLLIVHQLRQQKQVKQVSQQQMLQIQQALLQQAKMLLLPQPAPQLPAKPKQKPVKLLLQALLLRQPPKHPRLQHLPLTQQKVHQTLQIVWRR